MRWRVRSSHPAPYFVRVSEPELPANTWKQIAGRQRWTPTALLACGVSCRQEHTTSVRCDVVESHHNSVCCRSSLVRRSSDAASKVSRRTVRQLVEDRSGFFLGRELKPARDLNLLHCEEPANPSQLHKRLAFHVQQPRHHRRINPFVGEPARPPHPTGPSPRTVGSELAATLGRFLVEPVRPVTSHRVDRASENPCADVADWNPIKFEGDDGVDLVRAQPFTRGWSLAG